MTDDLSVELILDAHARVGEGPVWDDASGTLVWVDIMSNAVHRYDPATDRDRSPPPHGDVRDAVLHELLALATAAVAANELHPRTWQRAGSQDGGETS